MRDHTLFFLPLLRIALLTSLVLGLVAGCSFFEPHKITVSQGSWVDTHKVDQLEYGMSKEQVNYLLGTPLLKDVFAPDTWIYSYRETIGTEKLRERRLRLDFENDSLVRMKKTLPSSAVQTAVSNDNSKDKVESSTPTKSSEEPDIKKPISAKPSDT